MDNLVWWCFIVLNGLSALANIYDAGRGRYEKINNPSTSAIAGFIGVIMTLWGILTLVR